MVLVLVTKRSFYERNRKKRGYSFKELSVRTKNLYGKVVFFLSVRMSFFSCTSTDRDAK